MNRMQEPRSRRFAFSPWLVLGFGLAFTFASAFFTRWYGQQGEALRFENAVDDAIDRIVTRIAIYQTAIRGGVALFAASDQVTAEEFSRFTDRMAIQQRYPGIQGIGYSERVAHNLPEAVDERHEIRYLEPLDDRNRAAIGFDMYSEPVRREAMRLARDLAEQAMTGKVTLVQEIRGPKQPGFLIYSPVFREGRKPATLSERRERLIGFVYSPFRARDLFTGIFGPDQDPRVNFAVYDGGRVEPGALLYETDNDGDPHPRYTATRTLNIAHHHWTVVFGSEPIFEDSTVDLTFVILLLLGSAASIWLFFFSRGQALARAQAEIASQARGAFLATMSHELRTPLNAIGGYVELLALEIPGPLNEKQQEYLVRIGRAQTHLLGLINSILNYSKLEARRVQFRFTEVDVGTIVSNTETLITPQTEAAELTYTNRGGPAVTVRADEEKLTQILLNLLSNAIKFTDRGGAIAVWWDVVSERARIHVQDTGIGIEPERLDAIFDPFIQVDADLTRTVQGTGLGLSIARELARAMGGDLTVESVYGKGATFTIVLPKVQDQSS